MKKLGFALVLILLMLPLVPYAGFIALYPVGSGLHSSLTPNLSPLTSHLSPFIYMFGHANLIHWAINSWCILMLHNTFCTHRLVASYISASIFGLLWSTFASASSAPVLGFSAILFWFFGYLLPYYWHTDRMAIFSLFLYLGVGFLLPNLAGSFHLGLLVMGFIYYHCEKWFRRFLIFVSENGE